MPPYDFALIRVAALSVEETARSVDSNDFTDPHVEQAIRAAAGPSLLKEASTSEHARDSVMRYVARMGGRATPFGLFAGIARASIRQERSLKLGTDHRVSTRIDLAALEACVSSAIEGADALASPLRANPLVRQSGAALRFARPGDATTDVVSVTLTEFIAQVLEILDEQRATGAKVRAELLHRYPQLDADQITDALTELIGSGLVEADLGLIAPGEEPAIRSSTLLRTLGDERRAKAVDELHHRVCGEHPLRASFDQECNEAWKSVVDDVPEWASVPYQHRFDHQLHLDLPDAGVDARTVRDLEGAVGRLRKLRGTATGPSGDGDAWSPELNMESFRKAFQKRYEDAEVPLLEALDLESGVLHPPRRQVSTIAMDAGIHAVNEEAQKTSISRGLLDIFRRSYRKTTVDIGDLPAEEHGSRAVLALLLDNYEGRYTSVLVGSMGRSPFALMARFALNRPELSDAMAAHIAAERDLPAGEGEAADPIHAELIYNPGGRIANVLIRPRLYADTIALSGASGGTLSLDQLSIRLSQGRLRLRDMSSGRPVVLELNSAHNVDFHGLDPVYALLGRLAGDGGVSWNWEGLATLDHLPRVTCGSVIVSPEQWRLNADAVATVLASATPSAELRSQLGLADDPRRWVGSGVLDHILPIDLSSDRSTRLTLSKVGRKGDSVTLVEMPQAEAPATHGPTGRHVTEVLIPVGRAIRPAAQPPRSNIFHSPDTAEGWVYVRFACGFGSADHVINAAATVARSLRDEGVIDRWFFVRYSEGGHHIRFRVHAGDSERTERALLALAKLAGRLTSSGLVTSFAFEPYVPEVTRYGGRDTLSLVELLFTASSDAVSTFLATGPSEADRLYRAVGDIVAWAAAVSSDPADAIRFVQDCSRGLSVRFAKSGNRHGKLLRNHRTRLAEALVDSPSDAATLQTLGALISSARDQELDLLPIIGSSLHMHCNRLFAFDAVRLEYLAHEFAVRRMREMSARKA